MFPRPVVAAVVDDNDDADAEGLPLNLLWAWEDDKGGAAADAESREDRPAAGSGGIWNWLKRRFSSRLQSIHMSSSIARSGFTASLTIAKAIARTTAAAVAVAAV